MNLFHDPSTSGCLFYQIVKGGNNGTWSWIFPGRSFRPSFFNSTVGRNRRIGVVVVF